MRDRYFKYCKFAQKSALPWWPVLFFWGDNPSALSNVMSLLDIERDQRFRSSMGRSSSEAASTDGI